MDNVCNVTTGEVRMSYVHLFKPYAAMPGQEEKYSVTVLVPKTDMDTMGRINAAIEAAKQRGISENGAGSARRSSQHRCMTGTGYGRLMAWHLARSVKGTGCLPPVQKRITRRRS